MELRHLRYFVAAAEDENVSKAARRLHVSQPALSRQIRDLEDEIGFPLFERGPKSLKLSEAGRLFLAEARAVLQRAGDAVQAARRVALGKTGELHVGYAPSLTARLLPPALRAFQLERPGVRVKLHDLSTEEMLAGLREGKLHLAFGPKPTPAVLREFDFEELAQDSICLAVGPHHPFARRRTVTVAEAARQLLVFYSRREYPEAHALLDAVFASVPHKPRIVEEHDSVSSLIAAVEAGAGAAVTPVSLACTAGPRLKLLALRPAPAPLRIGAILPKAGISSISQEFLNCARKSAREIRRGGPGSL